MRYLKTFRLFENSEDEIQNKLYDYQSLDKDDERKKEMEDFIKPFELDNSEEGSDWSDNEREKINSYVKNLPDIDTHKPVTSETSKENRVNALTSSVETSIKKAEEIIGDERYKPKSQKYYNTINQVIHSLKDQVERVHDYKNKYGYKSVDPKDLDGIESGIRNLTKVQKEADFKYYQPTTIK